MIKWLNENRGFGFITKYIDGIDTFAHFLSVCSNGFKTVLAGQKSALKLGPLRKVQKHQISLSSRYAWRHTNQKLYLHFLVQLLFDCKSPV
ncbi:cold shock domain-containing protein [Vibrio navarrensis]|uniref:cold shock domain-containing protein n=1 Tax=Vibrio navarrensis TaxID=29495 RepID=UPI001EE3B71A|nr:cold shock domain-containing protein [Vibrio navarrensis]